MNQEMIKAYEDESHWATARMRKRTMEKLFNGFAKDMKRYELSQGNYLVGAVGARRQKAILRTMDKVIACFSSAHLIRAEKTFSENELFNSSLPQRYIGITIQLSAALWILDKLMITGKIWEANKAVFPHKEAVAANADKYLPPNFIHAAYPNETVAAVLYVLINRYSIEDVGMIYTENAARNEPLSETYRKLISLLPEADVKAACDTYRAKVWEVITRTMKAGECYENRVLEIRKKKIPYRIPFDQNDQVMIMREKINMILDLNEMFCMDQRSIMRKTGSRDVANAIAGFRVEDPYEICFALMYLIATDDDTPWLLGSNDRLMVHTARMLPWFTDDADDPSEDPVNDADDEDDDEQIFRNNWLADGPIPDMMDLYHERHKGKNYAQIIYTIGEGVVPVGIHPYEKDRLRLIAEGMDTETAKQITDISERVFYQRIQTMAYADMMRTFIADNDHEKNDDGDDLFDDEDNREHLENEKDFDAQAAEISALKRQVKNLKSSLAVTRQEANKEKAQYERELRMLRMEHRELADLREIAFRNSLPKDELEKHKGKEEKISYPYTTKKRTVVFGGHDSFLKSIKPLLADVRFIDVDTVSFDPDIVRNADVVWIQTNCLSHKQYWSVVKYCKQSGTQMRYFVSAGAEKCAEQLIKWDQL